MSVIHLDDRRLQQNTICVLNAAIFRLESTLGVSVVFNGIQVSLVDLSFDHEDVLDVSWSFFIKVFTMVDWLFVILEGDLVTSELISIDRNFHFHGIPHDRGSVLHEHVFLRETVHNNVLAIDESSLFHARTSRAGDVTS